LVCAKAGAIAVEVNRAAAMSVPRVLLLNVFVMVILPLQFVIVTSLRCRL
jgi:hypothetical protein